MGTGSLGGGSGSAGGGGSGSGVGARGSLLRAIEGLREISRRLTSDSDQPRLTQVIHELLRERGRSAFIRDMLTDGFAASLLADLLEIGAKLDEGASWEDIARAFSVDPGAGCMQAVCDARIDMVLQARDYTVDDRYVELASAAFRDFLVSAIGGDRVVATRGNAAAIDAAMKRDKFHNTIDRYLGALIFQALGAESYRDLGAAASAVRQAADTVAIGIYDRFDMKFLATGKAERKDVLHVLADNYFKLVTPT